MTTEKTQTRSIADTAFVVAPENPIRIKLIKTEDFDSWLTTLDAQSQSWVQRQGFAAKPNQWASLDDSNGEMIVAGWDGADDIGSLGSLPLSLPEGDYELLDTVSDLQVTGWGLGSYQFSRYKKSERQAARLSIPAGNNAAAIVNICTATCLTRDLINTPAQDMAPSHLEAEVAALAEQFGGHVA